MKKRAICYSILCFFLMMGIASATGMTYEHFGDRDFDCEFCPPPADKFHIWVDGYSDLDEELNRYDSVPLSFDLGNDGFDAGTDFAYVAGLLVGIHAMADTTYWGWYSFDSGFPRLEVWDTDNEGHSNEIEILGLLPLIDLNDTGLLDVTLTNTTNRDEEMDEVFRLKSAYLGAIGCEKNPNPVPEPATMLLLGSGLVGLAGFGRKKFRKK